jgi:hypothetical protein
MIVTEDEADFVGSACAIAATDTLDVLVADAGAENNPSAVIVPTIVSPPVTPFTCHVTAVLVLPDTWAVNGCCAPVLTLTEVGEIDTDIVGGGGGVIFPPLPHPKKAPKRNSTNHSLKLDFIVQPHEECKLLRLG